MAEQEAVARRTWWYKHVWLIRDRLQIRIDFRVKSDKWSFGPWFRRGAHGGEAGINVGPYSLGVNW